METQKRTKKKNNPIVEIDNHKDEYKKGFKDGYDFQVKHMHPVTGRKIPLPKEFQHRGNSWSRGFGEGLMSGSNSVFDKYYPGLSRLIWNDKTKQYDVFDKAGCLMKPINI